MSAPRAKPGEGAKQRRSCAKPGAPVPDDDGAIEIISVTRRQSPIEWSKEVNLHWTDTLITYLCKHPEFRIKLFSDSTGAAKKAGRPKLTAKDGCPQQWAILVAAVFTEDKDQKASFAANPKRFATSVETRMRKLKADYQELLITLSATGAGLRPDKITVGSSIANMIDGFREKWPWWDDLHGFWRELPNYNPIGVQSSEPGTDHVAAASALFTRTASEAAGDPDGANDAATAHTNNNGGTPSPSPSWRSLSRTLGSSLRHSRSPSITPPPSHTPKHTISMQKPSLETLGSCDLGRAKLSSARDLKGKTPVKPHKRSHLEKFNDNREADLQRLTEKHKMLHEEQMVKHSNKCLKLRVELLRAENEAMALRHDRSPVTSSSSSSSLSTSAQPSYPSFDEDSSQYRSHQPAGGSSQPQSSQFNFPSTEPLTFVDPDDLMAQIQHDYPDMSEFRTA